MKTTHPLLSNEDADELATDTDDGTRTLNSEEQSASAARLDTLRTLLRKRNERKQSMNGPKQNAMLNEKPGPRPTESDNETHNGAATSAREDFPLNQSTSPADQSTNPTQPSASALAIVEPHLVNPDGKSKDTLPTLEMIASPSMSLLDESAQHMFGLMKGLHANQPPAEVRSFDPERVNSAVACANTIYKIMRLKLDAIKVQSKLK